MTRNTFCEPRALAPFRGADLNHSVTGGLRSAFDLRLLSAQLSGLQSSI